LQNNITNAHEIGLPLVNYIILNEFNGPMVFGIPFEKVNFYSFFAKVSPKFSDQATSYISDCEKWLNRPEKWTYTSTTTFFRAIEVINISKNDKIEDEFWYTAYN
jgi:hypothetical protein